MSASMIFLCVWRNRWMRFKTQHGPVAMAFCLYITLLQALKSWTRELCTASGKHELYSRRNRKPCRDWPLWRIWLVAQTQECQVAVTRSLRPLLSGFLPSLLGPSSPWGCLRWPASGSGLGWVLSAWDQLVILRPSCGRSRLICLLVVWGSGCTQPFPAHFWWCQC